MGDTERGAFRFVPSAPQRQAPQRSPDPVIHRSQPDHRAPQPGHEPPHDGSRRSGPVFDAMITEQQQSPRRCGHQGCPWAARLGMDFCGDHESEQLPPPSPQQFSARWCSASCGQPAETGRDLCADCNYKKQCQQPQAEATVSETERAIRKLTGAQASGVTADETEPDLEHGYLVQVVGADAVRLTMADADEPDAPEDVLTFNEVMTRVYPRMSREDQPLLLAAMDAVDKGRKARRDPEPEQDEISFTIRERRTRRGFSTGDDPPGRGHGRRRQQPEG